MNVAEESIRQLTRTAKAAHAIGYPVQVIQTKVKAETTPKLSTEPQIMSYTPGHWLFKP